MTGPVHSVDRVLARDVVEPSEPIKMDRWVSSSPN